MNLEREDFSYYNEEDELIQLPTKKEVCSRCKGVGSIALPGVAFTEDEWQEAGEDFHQDYWAGLYDQECPTCSGRNVVDVLDVARCSPGQLEAWQKVEQELWDSYAMSEAERRAGA